MNARQIVFCSLSLFVLAACAQPAERANMVFKKTAATIFWEKSPLLKAITIKAVNGGEETNPLWTSEVDNAGFRHALEASFRNHDLLTDTPAQAKLDLTVTLRKLTQPFGGFNMTVTSDVQYLLGRRIDNTKAGGFIVQAPYTATFGDAAYGVTRLRLANEGAIRENIGKFLKALSRMNAERLINAKPKSASRPGS
jgi:hypothetical protein